MSEYERAYRYENRRRSAEGTRWATTEEICSGLTRVDLRQEKLPACGVPIVSEGAYTYVNNSDAHALIFGSTSSGKSRRFAMPMMGMCARAGESVLVTDPKGELYERTSGLFAQQGYRILVINLRDPRRSHGFSPLHMAKALYERDEAGQEEAFDIVNDLSASMYPISASTRDAFWPQTSRAVLAGLALIPVTKPWLFTPEQISLWTVNTLASHLDSEEGMRRGTTTNNLVAQFAQDDQSRINLESGLGGSDKTFLNIMVSFRAPLQVIFSRPALVDMLSTPEVDFERLGTEKTVLYLIMPDEKDTYNFIVSLVIKQAYEALIRLAQKQKDKRLPVRVNFLLDEFSNLPAIPGMCSMISAARSRNIRFYLFVQSLHQLAGKYGEDEASTIRGNCVDWVFLSSRELPLLTELSELCGKSSRTGEALISVSQLQRLDRARGEALILSGRAYPYLAQLPDIDRYPFPALDAVELPTLRPLPHTELDLDELIERAEAPEESRAAWAKKYVEPPQKPSPVRGRKRIDPKEYARIQAEVEKQFDELFGQGKAGQ